MPNFLVTEKFAYFFKILLFQTSLLFYGIDLISSTVIVTSTHGP